MLVRIIRNKGGHVLSVSESSSLNSAIKVMHGARVGSLLVVDGKGNPVGLLTEARIIEALARAGSAALSVQVDFLMQSPPPTCSISETIGRALRRMTQDRTRHLLVLDGEAVAGIVSIGDLVKARMSDIELENSVLRDVNRFKLATLQ